MSDLTLDQARERCAYWQRVLRLQDWDVDVKIVRRAEMKTGWMVASATIDQYRRAVIRLLDPIDYTETEHWPVDRDQEASLLHELMHLHLHDLNVREFDANNVQTPEWTALERACEATARALLAVDRQAGEPTV